MCGINVSIFPTIKGPVVKRSPLASSGEGGCEDECCNLKCKHLSLFLLKISKYCPLYNLYVQFLHKCTEFQPHDWLIIYFGWQVVGFYLMKLPGVWQKPVWLFAYSVASHFPIECIPFDGFSFFSLIGEQCWHFCVTLQWSRFLLGDHLDGWENT